MGGGEGTATKSIRDSQGARHDGTGVGPVAEVADGGLRLAFLPKP